MKLKNIPITIAEGDGIGPEIMAATLEILKSTSAPLEINKVEIGEKVYLKGISTGIEPKTWDIIRASKGFLKAPITTPQGGGFKSLNVTIRTTLGLYANVRPCISYAPFVDTLHPNMDVTIIRENEEDLYTGIEYRQTPGSYHALKIITRQGSEKIIRYAFEYARTHNRKKVTCFSKDNILKITDGLFHKIFDEIALEYPEIENEHWIVDIGAAKLADTPEYFDVIVMANLYGDILSDVAAQIAGSVGMAGSANIGEQSAMFEAIHGSAPRRAGQNLANPSGLIHAANLMLVHIGLHDIATTIHNAWLSTLEEGIHTYDIFKEGLSKEKVGTKEFAQAIIKRLGKTPSLLKPTTYGAAKSMNTKTNKEIFVNKKTVGIDVYFEWTKPLKMLYENLHKLNLHNLELIMITNRGVVVWPTHFNETSLTDCYRCRFMKKEKQENISHHQIVELLDTLVKNDLDFTHTENLCTFDGLAGYSGPSILQK